MDNLLINITIIIVKGNLSSYLGQVFDVKNLFYFLALNWTTPYLGVGHLWFLMSLVYVYIAYKYINKFKLYKLFYIYSAIALIAALGIETYICYFNPSLPSSWYRNAYLIGLPFFMIGLFCHSIKNKISQKMLRYISIILFGLATITFIVELHIGLDTFELFLSSILFSISLLLFAVATPNIKKNILSTMGEKLSSQIYIYHYATIIFFQLFSKYIPIPWIAVPFVIFLLTAWFILIFWKIKKTLTDTILSRFSDNKISI